MTFVSRIIIQEQSFDSWFWNRFARWYLKFHSAKRLKYLTNRLIKVFAGRGVFTQFILQDFPRLLLHGTPVLRGTNSELSLGSFWKLTDGYAGHNINDSIAIIDCARGIID